MRVVAWYVGQPRVKRVPAMIVGVITAGAQHAWLVAPGVEEEVWAAFQPLMQLGKAVSYPLTYISMCLGICMIILGQKYKGEQILKTAAIGYLLMQWLPALMKILAQVGSAMAAP